MAKPKRPAKPQQAESYKHPDAKSLMRPDVGTQAQFKKKKPPKTYRYDSSLSPALDTARCTTTCRIFSFV
jgi:adenine-specific DNA-methyltransferase